MSAPVWRRSSYSANNGACVEVAFSGPAWRKSSRSANNGECVEVAFSEPAWQKSSHSAANGACVEVALGERAVGARDSKDVEGGELWFSQRRWGNFVGAVKAGRYDLG